MKCKKLNYEQTDELQNMGTAITTSFLVMAMSSFLWVLPNESTGTKVIFHLSAAYYSFKHISKLKSYHLEMLTILSRIYLTQQGVVQWV